MIKNALIIIQILFALCLRSSAQSVNNVDFHFTGDKINIYYDLVDIYKCNVNILFKDREGNEIIPRSLSGDYGQKVKGGNNKKAVWDIFNDRKELIGSYRVLVETDKTHTPTNNLGIINLVNFNGFGLKYAHFFNRFGAYLSYNRYNDLYLSGGHYITATGQTFDQYSKHAFNTFIVGGMYDLSRAFKVYIGLGLFNEKEEMLIEDPSDGSLHEELILESGKVITSPSSTIHPDFSFTGELGIIIPIHRFIIDIGISGTSGMVFKLGIGYSF